MGQRIVPRQSEGPIEDFVGFTRRFTLVRLHAEQGQHGAAGEELPRALKHLAVGLGVRRRVVQFELLGLASRAKLLVDLGAVDLFDTESDAGGLAPGHAERLPAHAHERVFAAVGQREENAVPFDRIHAEHHHEFCRIGYTVKTLQAYISALLTRSLSCVHIGPNSDGTVNVGLSLHRIPFGGEASSLRREHGLVVEIHFATRDVVGRRRNDRFGEQKLAVDVAKGYHVVATENTAC